MDTKVRELLIKDYSFKEIQALLELNDTELNTILKVLFRNLENDRILYSNLVKNGRMAVGVINISNDGQGFINFGDKKFVIDKDNLNYALNGDLVVALKNGNSNDKRVSATVSNIIKRKDSLMIVNYVNGKLVPLNAPFSKEIVLSDEDMKKIKPDDRILVKINDGTEKVNATLKEVIGHKNDLDLEEKSIAVKYGFNIHWTPEIEKELEDIPNEVRSIDFKTHKDLRDKISFTIDDEATQDIDDGLFYEHLSNGHHLVGIPISHVSYYVKRHGAIYEEALYRGNSCYIGKHSEPMFPRKLCMDIGSLNPDVDRLTRTLLVEFDEKYNICKYKFIQGVIRSRKKMTYDAVDRILNGSSTPKGYDEFVRPLLELNKINEVLERRKIARGALRFYGEDNKVLFDGMNPVGFLPIRDSKGRLLIENYALLYNELFDIDFAKKGIMNINRVEEHPNINKLNETIRWLNAAGYNFEPIRSVRNPKEINNILNVLRQDNKFQATSGQMLKGMERAGFSVEELGHYGLQLHEYAQGTSPIRRYPDFINHNIYDDIDKGVKHYYSRDELEEIAEHSSYMEVQGDKAGKEGERMYMAEYMQNHIGESSKAMIIDCGSYGCLVKTDNNIIGRVNLRDIPHGKFKYSSGSNSLYDQKGENEYHIGDIVNVVAKTAIPESRTINFAIEEKLEKEKTLKKEKSKRLR